MIIGIGTDIVQIPRIERLVEKFGNKFVERILSKHEMEVYGRKSCRAFVARRFAGKEALSKALGKGMGRPLRFTDITIKNNELGKPEVTIDVDIGFEFKNIKIHASLSDDYPAAIAFVVIEAAL